MSTSEQTLAHQECQARQAGFAIDEVVADEMSGLSTRLCERPQGRRLFDMLRRGDTLVVRWVNRLGRDYEDVCDTMLALMKRGVAIRTVINNLTFDGATEDPILCAMRDAMITFMAGHAQAEAEADKDAQRAGIAYAREHGSKTGGQAYRGRKPSYSRRQLQVVLTALGNGAGVSEIAAASAGDLQGGEAPLSRFTIMRIKAAPAEAERLMALWEM